MERDYYSSSDEGKHEFWETNGRRLCDDFPQLKEFLSKIPNKTIRGFVACSAILSYDHNPVGGVSFILNYEYKDIINRTAKSNSIESIEECCRYYKGEDECPFDPRSSKSIFWRIEKIWDAIVRDDEIERSNKVGEFLVDFPDGVPAIENVPTSLKATLYDQYYRFGGNKDGFVEYLMTYLSDAE